VKRLCVLGGSPHHPGGVETFCARAVEAISATPECGWEARWLPTATAYLRPAGMPGLARALAALARARREGVDLVWLQFSNLPDLVFLLAARRLGLPVMVTPHLGANSRLQRTPALRRLCARLLRGADRIALLFPGQEKEIALPLGVPRAVLRTFLPAAALAEPPVPTRGERLALLHASRLSEGKGSVRMVDLCGALRRAGVPFSARIVGRGDAATLERIRASIAAHAVGDALTLTDWMAGDDLLAAMRAADVLVHLSTLDSYPLVVLEGMAAGCVPLVLDMAGVRAMTAPYGGHVARSVEDAAAWLAARPLADLRQEGAAIGAGVRRDHQWPVCADAVARAADLTLTAR
jgi:glycosyltransferase involved in cell wall biosynthesis